MKCRLTNLVRNHVWPPLQCWGENEFGELGQGDVLYRGVASGQMGDSLSPIDFPDGWTVSYLSVGYYHSCAMVDAEDMSTSVACWGSNENGQVGDDRDPVTQCLVVGSNRLK